MRGRAHRVLATIVVALFFVTLTGTGLIDTFFPIPAPKLAGWEADEDAERRREAKFSDGSLASLIEYDRRITSLVRQKASSTYSRALYKWFRYGNLEVVIGKDGWIFLRTRIQPPKYSVQEAADLPATRLAALDRALAMRGTKLIVVPVPRKCILYPEYLPLGVDPMPELDAQFEPALLRHGVPFAPIYEPFMAYTQQPNAEDEDPLYYKVGTHWTPQGELIAAREVARMSGMWKPSDELPTTITSLRNRPQEFDLFGFAGIEAKLGRAPELAGAKDTASFVVLDANDERIPREADQDEVGEVALAGTSFSAHRQLAQFIGHFVQKPVYNAAIPGANPIASATTLLEKSGPGLPKLMVLEIPNHYALLFKNLALIDDLLSICYPPELHALTQRKNWWLTPDLKAGKRVALNRRVHLTSLKPGTIAHTGEGILLVRVRGRLLGKSARIFVKSGSLYTSAKWIPHSGETVVPLILPATSGETVRVSVESTDHSAFFYVSPESIQVVATFDPERAWHGKTRSGDGAETQIEFEGLDVVPDHASFVLKLLNKKPPQQIRISAEVDGTWQELGVFSEMAAGGSIFVNLRSLGGKALTQIKASGLPVERVAEAYIAPLVTSEQ